MHIRSTRGPIDVYLCEVEQGHSSSKAADGAGTSSKNKHPEHADKGNRTESVSRKFKILMVFDIYVVLLWS